MGGVFENIVIGIGIILAALMLSCIIIFFLFGPIYLADKYDYRFLWLYLPSVLTGLYLMGRASH